MSTEVRNAIIESATLSTADHGVLSSFVHLDYGGSGQGFGGYALYGPDMKSPGCVAGLWIWRVLEIAGVREWSQLPGKTIRVRASWTKVEAIGHIVKDDWFEPEVEFARLLKP